MHSVFQHLHPAIAVYQVTFRAVLLSSASVFKDSTWSFRILSSIRVASRLNSRNKWLEALYNPKTIGILSYTIGAEVREWHELFVLKLWSAQVEWHGPGNRCQLYRNHTCLASMSCLRSIVISEPVVLGRYICVAFGTISWLLLDAQEWTATRFSTATRAFPFIMSSGYFPTYMLRT